MESERSFGLIETYASAATGPSFVVKDCIDIAGAATRCGSRAFADAPPAERHAMVVQALANRGYRLAGKAAMHELAYGMTGVNAYSGPVENPLFPGVIPGGSSSGSAAAVAAGLVDISLGTDTGGSVRLPAACCGIVGIKPTFGRISRRGVHPAATSLDCVGLFARSVAPVIAALSCLDGTFDEPEDISTPAIGLVDVAADPEITKAVRDWLNHREARVVACELPGMTDAFQAGVVAMAAEAHEAYGHLVGRGLLGPDVEQRLRAAPSLATTQRVCWAEQVRTHFTVEVETLFEGFDVLAMPTLPYFPPRLDAIGEPAAILQLSAYVRPFNLSGHPAISLPVPTPSGRPAAIQLVAAKGRDALLCAVAERLFEKATANRDTIQDKETSE